MNNQIALRNESRDRILAFEKKALELPQLEIPVKQYIHGGMYAREITIPKDSIVTGQIYKYDHFEVMIKGDITLTTDTGGTQRLTGYNCIKGMSGKKRAAYAHEDTTWVTFHPFDGDDGDAIQDFITADSFEELEEFKVQVNRNDYLSFVNDFHLNQKEITALVENGGDMIADELDCVYVSSSQISGKGLFSSKSFYAGGFICEARIKDKITLAGRYSNHALNANSEIIVTDEGAKMMAIKDIEENEEITVNYRDLMKHRQEAGDLCQE